jgi:N-acetylmuramoyl-L-alanine amidase
MPQRAWQKQQAGLSRAVTAKRAKLAETVAGLLCAVLAVFITLAYAVGAAAAPAAVTDAVVGRASNVIRLALELSDQVAFNVFTLPDPYRVVIDLPDVIWQAQALADAVEGPCGTIRHGEVRPGTWRLVLECTTPTRIQQARLVKQGARGGYRLVVELTQGARNGVLGYMTTEVHRTEASAPEPPAESVARPPAESVAAPRTLIGEVDGTGSALTIARPSPRSVQDEPAALSPPAAASAGTAALSLPLPPRRPASQQTPRIIVLDAGHGGEDPGAIGVSGIYEKTITLAAVREIKRELEKIGRYKVYLTRSDDRFISLRDRVDFARRVGADLFVSIHADSVVRRETRGASVYTLSKTASDSEAAALAEKENKADLIAGIDLSRESAEVTNILIDLAQRETMNQSAAFAGHLVRHLADATGLLPNPHRFAGFAVLKAPDIPSVLIELGFLSNRSDERVLRRSENRARLAAAVARAIDGYLTVTMSASVW